MRVTPAAHTCPTTGEPLSRREPRDDAQARRSRFSPDRSFSWPGPMLSHLKNLIKNIPKRRPPVADRGLCLHSPKPCKEPGALQSQEEGGTRSMSWASARPCLIQRWLRGRATCTRGSRLCCRHLAILAISSRIKWHFTKSCKGQWSVHGARRTGARGGERAGAARDGRVLPAPRGQGSHQTAGRHPAPCTPHLARAPCRWTQARDETREEGDSAARPSPECRSWDPHVNQHSRMGSCSGPDTGTRSGTKQTVPFHGSVFCAEHATRFHMCVEH